MHEHYNGQINKLRAHLREMALYQLDANKKMNPTEVAGTILKHYPELVKALLALVVCEEMDRHNDELAVEEIITRRPELEFLAGDEITYDISRVLGLPISFLIELDDSESKPCYQAAELIYRLRGQERQQHADALERAALSRPTAAPISRRRPTAALSRARLARMSMEPR